MFDFIQQFYFSNETVIVTVLVYGFFICFYLLVSYLYLNSDKIYLKNEHNKRN